jgi:predicted phosphodiesterase
VDFAPVVTVIGNQDRPLLAPPGQPGPTLAHTLADLGPAGIEFLRPLHALEVVEAHGAELLLCHGSPVADTDYLLEDVSRGVPAPRDPDEVADAVQLAPYPVICCGHTHMPRTAVCAGTLIVNPGSVGLQAYTDAHPPHAMQTGSPHARYTLLHRTGDDWIVERVVLPYDWTTAAETARRNGREDWAAWLATGRAAVPGPRS